MALDNRVSISDLHLHTPNNWKIIARIQKLSSVYSYGPSRKYFHVDLIDSTGKIRALGLNEQAEQLHKIFEENSVYSIENGSIEMVDKKYNRLNNDFQIIFNSFSKIQKEEFNDVPKHGKLSAIDVIFSLENNAIVDTIGVLIHVGIVPFKLKSQINSSEASTKMRTLCICDIMKNVITITIRNEEEAISFNGKRGDILGVLSGTVRRHSNGKLINIGNTSKLSLNPDWPEALVLRNWFSKFEYTSQFLHISQDKTFTRDSFNDPYFFLASQSQHNKLLGNRILNSITKENYNIDKRLDEIKKKELDLANEKLELQYKKQRLDIEKKFLEQDSSDLEPYQRVLPYYLLY